MQCGDNSTSNSYKALSEIHRVLEPKGVFICVSYGQPQHRENFLTRPDFEWELSIQKVFKPTISASVQLNNGDKDAPNVHFVYICKKTGSSKK